MNISGAAKAAGLPVKTVRYYADIELVRPTGRSHAGYREYDDAALRKLSFVAKARGFGFSIAQCRELLSLYEDEARTSAEVRQIAKARLEEIEAKQRELEELRGALSHLVEECCGDARPDCPIIDYLS